MGCLLGSLSSSLTLGSPATQHFSLSTPKLLLPSPQLASTTSRAFSHPTQEVCSLCEHEQRLCLVLFWSSTVFCTLLALALCLRRKDTQCWSDQAPSLELKALVLVLALPGPTGQLLPLKALDSSFAKQGAEHWRSSVSGAHQNHQGSC